MNKKSVKEQILELKKQKLLEVLLKLYEKKQILGPKPNPLSKYRSIYITYLKYYKKYPNDVILTKTLWQEKEFRERKQKIIQNGKN